MSRLSYFLLIVGAVALGGTMPAATAQTAVAAPTVSALSNPSGPVTGGARITVTGSHFAKGATVRFGSTAGRSVVVQSATRITVVVPAHAAGTVDLRVTVAKRTSAISAKDRYRYVAAPTVTAVSPNAALPAGGSAVTVRGTGFNSLTTIRFGTTRAIVQYRSATQLIATAPEHALGAVDLVAGNQYGTSKVTAATRFTYRDAPARVTAPRLAAVTATTATLRWNPSETSDVDSVIVRRASGTTAPATPDAGDAVATVKAETSTVLDSTLSRSSTYSYALFARGATGPLYSEATTITVTTPSNSAPDVPLVSTNPGLRGTESGCTRAVPCAVSGRLGGEPLVLAAQVSDPDGGTQRVIAHFSVWDSTGGGKTYLIAPDDPAGEATSVSGDGGYAIVRIDSGRFSDGHVYALDVVATDDHGASTSATTLYFQVVTTAPTVEVSSPDTSFVVGQLAHFHFSSTAAAANGPAAFDHFAYAFGSESSLAGDGGTHVSGTRDGTDASADINVQQTSWGTQYLHVIAVDATGNHSPVATFKFYVRS